MDVLGSNVDVGAILRVGAADAKLEVLSIICAYLPSILVPITFD